MAISGYNLNCNDVIQNKEEEIYSETEQQLIIELVKTMNQGNSGSPSERIDAAARQIRQLRQLFCVETIW